jgi:uncharacterized protein YcfJ
MSARTTQHRLSAPMIVGALGLVGMTLAASAQAGPRVGDVVGSPSTASSTIQARVVSSTPVIAQVAVPRQVCVDELQQQAPRTSGGAASNGAQDGAVGNALGKGSGNVLATGLGVIGGAILGDHVQNDGRTPEVRNVRRCEQQTGYENRVVAYSVVYEYGGQQYTTQMGQEPGATIPLQVSITPAVPGAVVPQTQVNGYYQQDATPVVIAPAPYVSSVRIAPQLIYRDDWWGVPRGRHGRWD